MSNIRKKMAQQVANGFLWFNIFLAAMSTIPAGNF